MSRSMKNMLYKSFRLIAIIFLIIGLVSCKAKEEPVIKFFPAEYIVSHKLPISEQQLQSVFNRAGTFRIKNTSANVSLIEFSNDPGLELLKELIKQSDSIFAVQPNYRYRKLQ